MPLVLLCDVGCSNNADNTVCGEMDGWMGGWKDGCLTWINLHFWMGVPLCNAASPVEKSADDADSHQELNHQGQVDFPYETFSETKKAHSRKADDSNNNSHGKKKTK